MNQNAATQGKLDSFGAIFLFTSVEVGVSNDPGFKQVIQDKNAQFSYQQEGAQNNTQKHHGKGDQGSASERYRYNSNHWGSLTVISSKKHRNQSSWTLCLCAAIRIARLASLDAQIASDFKSNPRRDLDTHIDLEAIRLQFAERSVISDRAILLRCKIAAISIFRFGHVSLVGITSIK